MNRFEISGYVSQRPTLRKLPSGTPVANVRLGQTYWYETKEGRDKHTNWFNLVFYGALSALAMTYDKGDNINVVGSIQQRQFTPKDGSTRTVHEVVVHECHKIAPPPGKTSSPAPAEAVADPSNTARVEAEDSNLEEADAWSFL